MKNLLIVFVLLLNGCVTFEPLINKKEVYSRQNLKTNGYYYIFKDKEEGRTLNEKQYNTFFLYKNGIYYDANGLSSFSFNISRLDSLDLIVKKNITNLGKYEQLQYQWGVFNVKGSAIEIERWVTSSGGGAYPTQILRGVIKNDSTINFHTKLEAVPLMANRKKKTFKIDETYHFRQFSPKPDSTNKFIK